MVTNVGKAVCRVHQERVGGLHSELRTGMRIRAGRAEGIGGA
jgi:hypothetical protein